MSLSPESALKLGVGLFIFAGCITFVIVALYIAYTKLDVMLGYFKNSPAVMIKAPLKNGGPGGRLFVLGTIVGVIKNPGLFIFDGGACQADIASFPQDLKKRLIAVYKVGGCFVWGLMIYSVVFVVDWSSMEPARFGVAVLTVVAILVWVFLCIHLGRAQIEALGNSFKNSGAIQFRLKLDAGGHFGKLIFIVAVSVIVACSRIFIKRGTLDANDYKSMSRNLKYKLYIVFYMSAGLVIGLFGLYFCRRLG